MSLPERAERCVSTGRFLGDRGDVSFPCPRCGIPLGRTILVRDQGQTYECPECDFVGP